MRSLRARLIAGTTVSIAAVLLAAGALVYVLVRASLVEQVDSSLADRARLLASVVEQESGEVAAEFHELDMGSYQRPDGPGFLQLWLDDGSVLYRSASLGRSDLQREAGGDGSPVFRWVGLPDGRSGRAVQMSFPPRLDVDQDHRQPSASRPAARSVTLVLARDAAPVEAALESLWTILLAVGSAAVIATLVVLWLVIQRGLVPLGEVAEQITSLGEDNLAGRVQADGAPEELRPIVNRLNELLARLEAAFRRERGFSADVAHELRTPLAGLRSTVDLALSKKRQPGDYEEMVTDCREIIVQMQGMVENLLTLARLEAGQVEIEPQPVFLQDVAEAAWQPMKKMAAARKLRVRWLNGPRKAIITDPTLLALVVRNILDNAVAYADEGGTLRIAAQADGHVGGVRVANTGSMIREDQTEMLFERFWRGDAARSEAGIHCGLGLPLVKRVISALGGSVEARCGEDGLFEISVSIPSLDARG